MTEREIEELQRDRDSWREVALALADLHNKVGKVLIDQKQIVRLDGRTLADALGKQMMAYSRRNGGSSPITR